MSTYPAPPGHPAWLLVYCLFNLLFFVSVQPYQETGADLLANGDFSQGLDGWQLRGDGEAVSTSEGVLTLSHATADSTTLAQCWLKDDLPPTLLLSGEARTQGVKRGIKSWHRARIDLVGYDGAGEGQYQVRTRLLSLEQDQPWRRAQALFELQPDAHRVCLEIALYHSSGRFQVQRLSLVPGAESAFLHIGRYALLAGWVVLALFVGASLYRHYRGHALGLWLLIAAGTVLAGVLLPHDLRDHIEQLILQLISLFGLTVSPDHNLSSEAVWSLWPERWDLSKLAHLIGFTVIGLLLSADRRLTLASRLMLLLAWAVASEVLQFFVPQRTPRLSDLVVDLLGVLIAVGLAQFWRLMKRSHSV